MWGEIELTTSVWVLSIVICGGQLRVSGGVVECRPTAGLQVREKHGHVVPQLLW